MKPDQIAYLIEQLKAGGVSLEAGLTDEEVQQAEQMFGFHLPHDLRAFLQAALPVSEKFVPWRWGIHDTKIARQIIQRRLQTPVEGLVFDAKAGSFWLPQWGERPTDPQQREQLARQQLAGWPPLIPLYSHRYLPAVPYEAGNPVFSVWGSDIVYYGYDLFSYFLHEFTLHCPPHSLLPAKPRHIAFWSDFDEPRPGIRWGYWSGDEGTDTEGRA